MVILQLLDLRELRTTVFQEMMNYGIDGSETFQEKIRSQKTIPVFALFTLERVITKSSVKILKHQGKLPVQMKN